MLLSPAGLTCWWVRGTRNWLPPNLSLAHNIVSRYIFAVTRDISESDYRALGEFRYQIRRFLHFSEEAARSRGLEPQQHQLLLAVRSLPAGVKPAVGNIADRLQIRHHSTVELIDRLVSSGLVTRSRDDDDRRNVIVRLTPAGSRLIRELSVHHREELRTGGPDLVRSLEAIIGAGGPLSGPGPAARAPRAAGVASR
jgi:DNA-binding MarR family transcriptional regulator